MENKKFKYSKETIDEIVAIYGTSSFIYKFAKEGEFFVERMVAENIEYRQNVVLGFEKLSEVINTKTNVEALIYINREASLGIRTKALKQQIHQEIVDYKKKQEGEQELKLTMEKERVL